MLVIATILLLTSDYELYNYLYNNMIKQTVIIINDRLVVRVIFPEGSL